MIPILYYTLRENISANLNALSDSSLFSFSSFKDRDNNLYEFPFALSFEKSVIPAKQKSFICLLNCIIIIYPKVTKNNPIPSKTTNAITKTVVPILISYGHKIPILSIQGLKHFFFNNANFNFLARHYRHQLFYG
jgi:hypothetical protein